MSDFFKSQNDLVDRARQGDSAAREQLILDNLFVAKQVAYTLMSGKRMTNEEKEDELQQANLVLVNVIDSIIKGDKGYNIAYIRNTLKCKLISWYRIEKYGVDNNSIKDEEKKQKLLNMKNYEPIEDLEIAGEEDFTDGLTNKIDVEMLLNKLTDDERTLIKLYYFDGLTQCEMSKRLGIPQRTISFKLDAILKKLKGEV